MTHTQEILAHLKSGKTVTAITALGRFGCFRLAARIHDLRKSGHRIHTHLVRDGRKTYASYRMGNS